VISATSRQVLRHVIARNVEANPDCDVDLEAPDTMRRLRGDPALLGRLFHNLIDNARKYSSGAVSVRARDDGGAVVVDVEDHGIGIDADDLGHIFEPFFRSDRSRQRATGGTGLGLALSRRIVELHRGSIVAESRIGNGTKVTVRLPWTDAGS
jgi:signal transduction histidine kinase